MITRFFQFVENSELGVGANGRRYAQETVYLLFTKPQHAYTSVAGTQILRSPLL